MKVLHELVPTRKFLKTVEEIKDYVDGWNITDSAAGIPAPSGTAVGCVLKTRFPNKIIMPIFVLNYKGPVEVAALALAADAVGLDGLVLTMGDEPRYGEPLGSKYWRRTEDARDFLKNEIKIRTTKLGCLLSPRPRRVERYGTKEFNIDDMINRVKSGWDFALFMRLTEETLPALEQLSRGIRELKLNVSLYTYVLIGTPRNADTLKQIGWTPTTKPDNVREFLERVDGLVDGVIITAAGDYQGELEVLKKIGRK